MGDDIVTRLRRITAKPLGLVLDPPPHPLCKEAADEIERLRTALAELAIREHEYCEDSWYSCPLAPDGCCNDNYPADVCNCGADEHNAKVRAAMEADRG